MLIAIDTSGPFCTVVVARRDGEVRAGLSENLGRGHAERLMSMVDDAMAQASTSWTDITLVGCTVGPGSFTGLRVGLAAAKGFALALSVPTIGVGVLDTLALPGSACTVVQDARRDKVWMQQFGPDGRASGKAQEVAVSDFAGIMTAGLPTADPWVGSGALLIDNPQNVPLVNTVGQITPKALARTCLLPSPTEAPLVPLYLRAADAKPQAAPLVQPS